MRGLALPLAQNIFVLLWLYQQRCSGKINTDTKSLGASFSFSSIARRHHRSRLSPLPPQVPLPLPLAHVVVVDLRCQLPPLKTTQINDGCPFMLLLPLSLSASAPPPFAVII